MEATAEISLAYFEQFFVTPFHCECVARNSAGEVKSRSATITLARKSLKTLVTHVVSGKIPHQSALTLIYL